jgi:hypothetical protein
VFTPTIKAKNIGFFPLSLTIFFDIATNFFEAAFSSVSDNLISIPAQLLSSSEITTSISLPSLSL